MDWTGHKTAIEECLRQSLAVSADTHGEFLYEGPDGEESVGFDSSGEGTWPLQVVLRNDADLEEDEEAVEEVRRYRVRVVLEPLD